MLNYLLFIKQKGFVTDQFLQRGGGVQFTNLTILF